MATVLDRPDAFPVGGRIFRVCNVTGLALHRPADDIKTVLAFA